MSQENISLTNTSLDVWNSGDMVAYGELLHPDVVTRPPPEWPEPGPFVGRDAALLGFQQIRDAWDADEVVRVSDFVATGDSVVVRLMWRGTGQGPLAALEMTCIYTVQDGRLIELDFHWDHSEALQAAGLPRLP